MLRKGTKERVQKGQAVLRLESSEVQPAITSSSYTRASQLWHSEQLDSRIWGRHWGQPCPHPLPLSTLRQGAASAPTSTGGPSGAGAGTGSVTRSEDLRRLKLPSDTSDRSNSLPREIELCGEMGPELGSGRDPRSHQESPVHGTPQTCSLAQTQGAAEALGPGHEGLGLLGLGKAQPGSSRELQGVPSPEQAAPSLPQRQWSRGARGGAAGHPWGYGGAVAPAAQRRGAGPRGRADCLAAPCWLCAAARAAWPGTAAVAAWQLALDVACPLPACCGSHPGGPAWSPGHLTSPAPQHPAAPHCCPVSAGRSHPSGS